MTVSNSMPFVNMADSIVMRLEIKGLLDTLLWKIYILLGLCYIVWLRVCYVPCKGLPLVTLFQLSISLQS